MAVRCSAPCVPNRRVGADGPHQRHSVNSPRIKAGIRQRGRGPMARVAKPLPKDHKQIRLDRRINVLLYLNEAWKENMETCLSYGIARYMRRSEDYSIV